MRFYQHQHRHTCGVDLHGRNLFLCILDQQGRIVLHKRLRCDPDYARKRAELLSHIQNTFTQYNLPRPSGRLTQPDNRRDLPQAFDDPAIRARIRADLSLIDHYDSLIPELEGTVLDQARGHDPDSLRCLLSVRGIGKILSLTILYEICDIR